MSSTYTGFVPHWRSNIWARPCEAPGLLEVLRLIEMRRHRLSLHRCESNDSAPSPARGDREHVIHDGISHAARDGSMTKQRAIVERSRQHIDHEIDIELSERLAALASAGQRPAHGVSPRDEHLLANRARKSRIMCHVRDEPCQSRPEGPGKGIVERAYGRAEIACETPRIRCRSRAELAQNGVGNEMALAWPAPVQARASTLYLARDAFDRHGTVTVRRQRPQDRGDDLRVNALISRPARAG